jgi:hypothetical protein
MRARVALLGVLAAALSACTLLRGYAPHDEGLMLAAARRMADGQLPYRDFWWNYAPGQPLLLAVLVKAFGPSLVAWRILRVAIDAMVSVLVYVLVRRDAGHERLALLASLAAAGATAWPAGPGPNPTALALALGALLVTRRRASGRTTAWGGALAGLGVLFRPEIGAAALLGAVRRGRALAAFLGVATAGLLPFFVAAPGEMWRDTVGFLGVQDMQRLPFPLAHPPSADPNKLLEYWFPAILVAGFALWLARRRWHPVAPLAVVGLLYLLARTDEFHLVPLSVALAVLLAVEAARASGAWRIALLVPLVLIALHGLERRAGQLLHAPPQARVPGAAGDGVTTDRADAAALRRLVPFVQRLTSHREAIFVANPRHDRVTAGDPALYVILDRPNATRYDVMQPGVVTTLKVQREIVGGLPRIVVRWLDPRASLPELNESARSTGVHVLDRALARDYRRVARFGVYQVLVRREPRGGIHPPAP